MSEETGSDNFDLKVLWTKLDPERFPHMSERLRLLVEHLFADLTGGSEIQAVTVVEMGDLYVRRHDASQTAQRLGHEAEIGEQLRRLAKLAGLTREERAHYEDLVSRRLGISLAPRYSCHQKL